MARWTSSKAWLRVEQAQVNDVRHHCGKAGRGPSRRALPPLEGRRHRLSEPVRADQQSRARRRGHRRCRQ